MRETDIRTLVQTTLCLLLALLVIVGGYAVSMACNPTEQIFSDRVSDLALPQAPGARQGVRLRQPPAVVDAAFGTGARPTGTGRVVVTGVDTGSAPLVVAIFAMDSGARLATEEVAKGQGRRTLTFTGLPIGRHEVRLSRCTECAKLAYISRAELTIGSSGGSGEASVDCTTRSLSVRLALVEPTAGEDPHPGVARIPVWIRRHDDASWHYHAAESRSAREALVLTDDAGRVRFDDLGRGTYTLHMQGFTAAPADLRRLTFELDEFDEARPITGRVH